ncbi:collagen-binding domain-containing protein [Colwelliaceae bacterium MEBiC 14330]
MRTALLTVSSFISVVLLVSPVAALEVDLGAASKYNAFIQHDFTVSGSDTQGRVAVGGDFIINGGNDVGTKIQAFAMGDGPSLVVGGDVVKSGQGSFNVYEAGVYQSPHAGELVYAGKVLNNGNEITSAVSGQVEAKLSKVNSAQLPVDFDDAFAHLNQLSNNLQATTASGVTSSGTDWQGNPSGPLTFTPTTTPSDNVYVFNVTQEQINQGVTWDVVGVNNDATIVFNISNDNKVQGSKWQTGIDHCQAGQTGCMQLNGQQVSVNGNRLDPVNVDSLAGRPDHHVLFNFVGATQVVLNGSTYGSILAPSADIKALSGHVVGQVIGKSWDGNMQINYNPLPAMGTPSIPTPATLWLFLLAAAFIYFHRQARLIKPITLVNGPAFA